MSKKEKIESIIFWLVMPLALGGLVLAIVGLIMIVVGLFITLVLHLDFQDVADLFMILVIFYVIGFATIAVIELISDKENRWKKIASKTKNK